MDHFDTDALLANDPDFAAICDARRDIAIYTNTVIFDPQHNH
jgi:hypothetical protein